MNSEEEILPRYELDPGSYWVGQMRQDYTKATLVNTKDCVWLIEPASFRLMKPVNTPVLLSYWDKASDQEVRLKGDDLFFLDWTLFKEFKKKIRLEIKKFGVHCPLDEFKVYKIGKGMTVSNVVQLLHALFHTEFNVPFDYIKRHTRIAVLRYPRKDTPSIKVDVLKEDGTLNPDVPFRTQWDGPIIPGMRLQVSYQHLEYDFQKSPEVLVKGDKLDGSEVVALLFRGEWIPKFPLLLYENERSKVLAMLYLFAAYHYDGRSRKLVCNEQTMGGRLAFDLPFLNSVLDIYYGREDDVSRRYFFY